MTPKIDVEPVTLETFNARRYILANRDLYVAFGNDAEMAQRHLHEYGLRENRHQLTAAFVASHEFESYLRELSETALPIRVRELVTPENFDPHRYILANSDLSSAFGGDAEMARDHFHAHGLKENRHQLTAAFVASRREKFMRFKETLPECNAECFPVNLANSLHQLSEYEAESSNGLPRFWVNELGNNPQKLYADIGAGLRSFVYQNCVNVEVYPSLSADIFINPHCQLPFKNASLDGIGCFAVLEHVNKPWELASEFARIVKPEGKIFIDWPFLQPVHGSPSHYYNATREGLRSLFTEKFDIEQLYTGKFQGPDYTVHWVLNTLLLSVKDAAVRRKLSETSIGDLCKYPPQSEIWQTILSTFEDSAVSTLSCGNTLIATKK